ncbi:MAG TPA: PIN domain-containing protein [Candidatus Dormibacteraeota bacterium]|nr:PIN domain-containing protein [Candidatus Dormibacteraeota bacterium]
MALIVIDASVVIALLDPADALHPAARRALERVAEADLAIPASALAETLVAPARAGRLEEARRSIRALELRVADTGEEVAVEAARLRAGHRSLRLPDALVLATAAVLGADVVLTGDASWGALSPQVRVID